MTLSDGFSWLSNDRCWRGKMVQFVLLQFMASELRLVTLNDVDSRMQNFAHGR